MICLELSRDGSTFYIMNPQPSDYSTCTYVLPSGSESSGFPTLTSQQGVDIAMAIAVLWGIGAVFRILINLMRPSAAETPEHS
jgi:hypothetical protein